jgi:hypothetical protein
MPSLACTPTTADQPEFSKPMSLSITPGAAYGLANTSLRPTIEPPPRPQPSEEAAATQSQRTRRAGEYVEALRELKAQQEGSHQNRAAQTYLNIAHFDGGFQLIDVYA